MNKLRNLLTLTLLLTSTTSIAEDVKPREFHITEKQIESLKDDPKSPLQNENKLAAKFAKNHITNLFSYVESVDRSGDQTKVVVMVANQKCLVLLEKDKLHVNSASCVRVK